MSTGFGVFGTVEQYLSSSDEEPGVVELHNYSDDLRRHGYETSVREGVIVRGERRTEVEDTPDKAVQHEGADADLYEVVLGMNELAEGTVRRASIEGPPLDNVSLPGLLEGMPGDCGFSRGTVEYRVELPRSHLEDSNPRERALERLLEDPEVDGGTETNPTRIYSEDGAWKLLLGRDSTSLHLQGWNDESPQVISGLKSQGFRP